MKQWLLPALMILVGTSSLVAQDEPWRLDKSHSSVGFTVTHMVISEVMGRFNDFDITFASLKEDFSDASVEVLIRVNSINTDNPRRDNDLRSDNFFSVETYPEIHFKSTSFEKGEGNKYTINGDLTIRDVTKPVAFDAEYRGSLKTARGIVGAWKASLSINRFDYGLKWDRTIDTGGLVVGETVNIHVSLELRK